MYYDRNYGYATLTFIWPLPYTRTYISYQRSKYLFTKSNIDASVKAAADHLRKEHIKGRFHYAPDEWPPYHPKHYTTLAFIHRKGKHTNVEVISAAQEMAASGNLSKNQPQSSSKNYHSKDISDLFPTVPIPSYFILIEGAPGIGKTVLSKEIACQWAENKLLKFKKLVFLLYLRDPAIKDMVMLEELTQYVLNNNKKGTELSDHLFETKGKDLTIIFDGYDEMSGEDKNDSLVTKILNRRVLSECDLIITSRPTATLHLRDKADCRVEVLGFTEEDRLDYIHHALEGSHQKIEILQSYLRSNTTINALCYIPLNMTILLCLFEDIDNSHSNIDSIKEIGLPNTQTEMYKNFILMSITRWINRSNKPVSEDKYLKITELPVPYNEIFNELLHLAYYALTKDKIVLNSDERFVQQSCRNLKSGNYEGLGLLKVTKFVKTTSFHFLHFSIQEYLAAHYIASQPDNFQLQFLKDTFWDIHYFNTWIMYVGMTGGKKTVWKHFVTGNRFMLSTKIFKSSKISKKYLNDKIKSLHLCQCYAEIGSKELVRKVFEDKVFEDKVIDLSNQTLLPKDINTICFFLLRSANKNWIKLDLSNCNIGIIGSDILCKTFLDKSRDVMNIDKVDLSHNQLQSKSILELLDVLKIWHASEAIIYGTYYESNLFESCLNKFPLYDDDFSHALLIGPYIFSHNVHIHNKLTKLANTTTGLYLNHCKYPPSNIKYGELSNKLNLSKLHIIGENIPCYYIITLVQTMKEVDSVYIYDHTLSDEDVLYISLMLCKKNMDNFSVWIVIGSTKILGNIPDLLALNKRLQCIETLNLTESIEILCSKSEMYTGKFNEHIHTESKSVFGNLFYLLHENIFNCEITFRLLENDILIANGVEYNKIKEVLFSNNHIVSIHIANYKSIATELLTAAELTSLLSKQESLEKLYISDSSLDIHNLKYENLLNHTLRLKELFIHTSNSSCVFNFDLLKAKEFYPNISVLLLTNNILIGHNPTCEQILLSLKLEPNLTTWRINHFPIDTELLQNISNSSSMVMELDIVDLTHEEQRLQEDNNRSNDVQHNLESNDKLVIINVCKILSYFPKLTTFNFSYNDLQEADTGKVFGHLNVSNLRNLNISCNEINKQVVDDIAKLLSQISMLKGLDLSCNNLQATDAVKLLSEVENISSCTKLNINNNDINGRAAHYIATFLCNNTQLKELNLSHSNLQTVDALTICNAMSNLRYLTKLNISNNDIDGRAAEDIAVFLSQNNKLEELDISYNHLQTAGIIKIFEGIKHVSTLLKLNIAHNMVTNKAGECIVHGLSNKSKLKELNLSHANLKYSINIRDSKHSANKVSHFLSRYPNLQVLNLSYTNLEEAGFIEMLNEIDLFNLTKFDISGNSITTDAADNIAVLLSKNDELEDLNLSCNNLQEPGIRNILDSINISNLSSLNISDNHITGLKYIADILTDATKLVEFDVSYNKLSAISMMYFLLQMTGIFVNLVKLNLSGNIFSNEVAESLADALQKNTVLIELSLNDNNLHVKEIREIFDKLKISSLMKFRINHNNITDQAADYIATFLSKNTKLEELDLSHNNLLSAGAMKFFKTNLSKLTSFNISHNGITASAAEDMAIFLSRNTKLQQLDLNHNSLLSRGIMIICKINLSKLTTISIGHNSITVEATDDIADFLSHNTKLQVLDLSCSDLQEAGCRIIFKKLQNVSTLTSLKVSNCNINAVDELSTVMDNNMLLQELGLSYNNLSKSDFSIILKKMKKISNLITLDVSHNMITDEASDELETVLLHNLSLQQLNLSHNNFSSLSVVNLLKNVSNLMKINISYTRITNTTVNSLVDLLICNPSLKEINLSSNHISASNAVKIFNAMENISNLEAINISNNMITDEAAESIATVLSHNNKLKSLNLSSNYFMSEGFVKIFNGMRNIIYLKELNISSNEITALNAIYHIAKFLFRNWELEILDLSNCFIQKAGIIKIFEKMKAISSLKKLYVYGNVITEEAADAVTSILSQNNKLEEINIGYTSLPTESVVKIFQSIMHISTLTSLNIAYSTITNEAAKFVVSIVSKNNKLRELNLSHSEIILSDLSNCTNLQKLDLSYTNPQTSSIIENLNFLTLKKFSISANQISASELNNISNFLHENDELQELDVSFNNLQEVSTKSILNFKNFVNALNCATKLVELDLSYNKFSSIKLDFIFCTAKSIFVNVMKLNLSGNKICNGAVNALVNALAQNSKLKELSLCDASIQSEEINKIFSKLRFPHLTRLFISHNGITDEAAEDIAGFLSKSNGLEELDVSHNNLKSIGIIKICRSNLTKLTLFKLSHNNITDEASTDIASFLSQNSELQVLDMSCNDLETGCRTIFTKLRSMMVLSVLKLTNCHLIKETADKLANVLLYRTLLQELDISCNNLSTSAAISIFKGMRNISHLTAINISHNMITDEAAEDIATVISCNHKLQSLDLSYNCFTSKGFISIFNCLNTAIYLRKLNVSSNEFDFEAAHSISTVLSHNTKLEELDLSSTCINTAAATMIFKSLRNSSDLKKMYINGNMITDEAAKAIAIVVSCNRKLQSLDLSRNYFTSEVFIRIFESKSTIHLRKLNISSNEINVEAALSIGTVLSLNSKLEELDLSNNRMQTPAATIIFKNLKESSNLKKIYINDNLIADEAVDELAIVLLNNTSLQKLDLSYNDLSASDTVKILKGMKKISKLKSFNISHNTIDFEVADKLAAVLLHNASLQKLDLSSNNLSTSDAIKIFKGMKNISKLKAINISHNMIDCGAADELVIVLSHNNNLQSLDMSYNHLDSEGCIKIMNEMNDKLCLKKIDISYNLVTFEAANSIAEFLSHITELEELTISGNDFHKSCLFKKLENKTVELTLLDISSTLLDVDDIVTGLMHNTKLEAIDLSNNKLLSSGIIAICHSMKNILNLKKIDISHNCVNFEAANDIANVLSLNANLQELNLNNNTLQSCGIITIFNKMNNVKLTHLDISSNKITDEAANDIAIFLLQNNNLKVLDLSYNLIRTRGTRIIFGNVDTIFSLKVLNLSGNELYDEAVDTMATFISQNPLLEEFDISKNYIQGVGAVKIFKAIQNCPGILKVNMSNNQITDKAGYEIASVISKVTKLREVDLAYNKLSTEVSEILKKYLLIYRLRLVS